VVSVSSRLSGNLWSHISATYDNGDKSDNWCGSHTPVPREIIGSEYYDAPKCGIRNYFIIGMLKIEQLIWASGVDDAICM
jgi:hypothetical protein